MMQRHSNLVPHNPPHTYGDCHRICFAVILGLQPQDVPHFLEQGPASEDTWVRDAGDFLAKFGLKQIDIQYPGEIDPAVIIQGMKGTGVACILGGKSRTGCGHSVVVYDGEIFCDPTESGIVAPFDCSGYYHLTFFVAEPDFAQREVTA